MESNTVKVLGFELNDQWFAMEISAIREVVEWYELTAIPNAPECALGVFNYHGRVITVVDPTHFFGIKAVPNGLDTRIVILSGEDFALGFRVDRADKIEPLPREGLLEGSEGIPEKGFIRAVVPMEDRLYNIVDSEPLLDAIEEEFLAVNAR